MLAKNGHHLGSMSGDKHCALMLTQRCSAEIDWSERLLFLITDQDGGILLDLDNDELLKLDPVTAEMWKLLSEGQPKEKTAAAIAEQCHVDTDRVIRDLQALLDDAAKRGIVPNRVTLAHQRPLMEEVKTSVDNFPWYGQDLTVERPVPKPSLVLRALVGLCAFDLALSLGGFRFLCRIVNRWNRANCCDGYTSDFIGLVCVAVEKACVWYPKKSVCLQRSAVTACLLRSFGVPAAMVIGARPMPLDSHAWVEVNGAVVNDHLKITTIYKALLAL